MGHIESNLSAGRGRGEHAQAVRPASTALRELVAAIEEGAHARANGDAETRDAIALVREARLGVYRLPVEEGGGGATLPQLFELVFDLAQADSNIPHILRNHFAFVERALRTPNQAPYSRWLDSVKKGALYGLGASELGKQNIGDGDGATSLAPQGDGFVLDGVKYYSTGNLYADYIVVNAKTQDGRFVAARVAVGQKGVDVRDDWDGIGQRLTASGTTVYDHVEVSRDDVLYIDDEFKVPWQATFSQLWLTTIIAGILRRVVKDAVALLKRRDRNYYHAVNARPADDPLLQQIVGRLDSAAYVAESSVLRAADALGRAYDSALAGTPDEALFLEAALNAARSKVLIDELALDAATRLFDVGGASAGKQSAALDRHWRNIRTIASHNPVAYKARVLGEHALHGTPLPKDAFF
ncbi:acyl-CoA dehydrogenase [Caballeronia arationis]|jgi:alkylation response protein AidB-like acyl-CoA dehydrogenase|uniref:Acyl-CoA dehydrogenase n=1 Tax=Caballeronia arationis TaxID=1777142 RepID=A0A7Z7N1M9_9BURK|nr:acyl-CoA dehydrogenase [Caballeronia arationis]SAK98784.1 acyl-CoA dehydrogenase [Caballeronia arationis]SOE56264.1 Acyl-CoA dehydrogenase [Caballeronia arationis]